ncbi:2TM domain-containing protein [Flavobacterium psychrotrophum]|uniref:2TM domain-containing protein n=1 Tax=Flavobacterium psychrotrophum TaxID=2294119 RepID=UPI000E30F4B2|nr:2TM domain-containing protein [Flavobacterium psychrotrophum]
MENYNEQDAYKRARKKVREIKGFYINVVCYCTIIPILIYVNLTFVPEFHWFWFSALGWGTGLMFHGFSAFGIVPGFSKDWEERKLREFMEKENNIYKK